MTILGDLKLIENFPRQSELEIHLTHHLVAPSLQTSGGSLEFLC